MLSFFNRGRSFGEILDANKGAGPGFDLLRLGLAVAILLSHTSGITGNRGFLSGLLASLFQLPVDVSNSFGANAPGAELYAVDAPVRGLARPYSLSLVPMFFALSGFLVTGSALRTRNAFKFIGLRALRIVPALFVEVVLSAFILGAVFTTLPLREYFSDPGFFRYFGNIIGHVTFVLPGVFEHTSQSKNVNSNLWTLPFEFDCYAVIFGLILTGLLYKRVLFTVAFAVATVALLIANSVWGYHATLGTLPGVAMVYFFFSGVLFFLWRYEIRYNLLFAGLAIVICYPLMMSNRTVYIYPIFLTYITMFIGLTAFPRIRFLQSGDYSYGIYLYGYPVIQAIVATAPALKYNLAITAPLAVGITFAFSIASWHLVEKHFLKLKVYLSPRSAEISKLLHPDIRIEPSEASRSPEGALRGEPVKSG
ncbi:acyltransferase [Terrarubrum flagellatum]|uniref:acyltransferase family protein n=1 Tax=Terrirubrum flagellatum TaxID=2895980 RepID=UPI0031450DED